MRCYKKKRRFLLPLVALGVMLSACYAATSDTYEISTLEAKTTPTINAARETRESTAILQNSTKNGDTMPESPENTDTFDPNFYIFLCFGQSNMEGAAPIEPQDRTVDARFQVLQSLDCPNLGRSKNTWYPAVPPLTQCYSGLSPADYFGRTMVTNLPENIRVGVINVAVGGCDIRLFDKDLYQDYDDTYKEAWFMDKIKAYGGNPYQHLINLAKLAQRRGVIKGILLHQGETNTGDRQWPHYVHKIYNDILADLSLDAASVPLLAGEVVEAEQGGCCASMNSIIATLPDTIPTAHVISSHGCTAQDNAHFDSAGVRELGRRYAEKMLSLMGYTIGPTEITP